MMTAEMAPKTTKKPVKTAQTTHAGRKKSKLTQAREDASRLAGRSVLLTSCEALKWNLTRVAEALEMSNPSDVIRALKELAPEEYEAARLRGDIAKRRDSQD